MTTIHFEYDPERLIDEVRQRPGIWDFEDVAYRTKSMRHKLWTDVVNQLMDSEVKVTKSEMRELELQLQKKWKSIRDCFQKYVINPNRSKRPYVYCKKLQFLLKNQEVSDHGIPNDTEESNRRTNVWRPKRKLKITKESSDDDNDNEDHFNYDDSKSNCSNEVAASSKSHTAAKQPKLNSGLIDEFAFANVDVQGANEPEDCDKLFLLSLLPHLKSIPEENRLNVKMEMMNVLRNANFHTSMDHKIF